MSAPAPLNLKAMTDAWDDPAGFAHELNAYYAQLAASGHRLPACDWTEMENA